jgi:hypothetical protein
MEVQMHQSRRSIWSVSRIALAAAMAASLSTAGVERALADAPDTDSAALSAETDAALMAAGQQANDALNALMADRAQQQSAGVAATPNHVPLNLVPSALIAPVSLTWNGSSVELAQKLADAVGFKFVVSGTAPTRPVVVTMVIQQEPVVWALQDLGVRIRDTARVSVNPGAHEIDYTYNLMSGGIAGGIGGAQ